MNEYYFHLDHLTVGYDKKPLIKDICIGIEKGEIVTLIGPNGSGKSTILKSITRQLKLVGGNVEFDGKNLHELSFRELPTKMAVDGAHEAGVDDLPRYRGNGPLSVHRTARHADPRG